MGNNSKILVVSQVLPYPLHDGGKVDIYYRLQALQQLGFEVDLVCFYNPAQPLQKMDELRELCSNLHLIPWLRRKCSAVFQLRPYFIACRENHSAIDDVASQLRERKYVSVVAESHHVLTVAQRLKRALHIPKLLLRIHNDESKFMMTVSRTSPMFSLSRPFFFAESLKYRAYERKLLLEEARPDALMHISSYEQAAYARKYPELEHFFLPAGLNIDTVKAYRPTHSNRVLFVGGLSSPNNLQGVQWYLNKVHPLVVEAIPDYHIVVAGSTSGGDLGKLNRMIAMHSNIEFHDTPADLTDLYANAALFVNPMQFGAGVKLKTVHAIAQGLPVVSTTIGNEGTGFRNSEHVEVVDTPIDFKQRVVSLLKNETARRSLVQNAQSYLNEHYNQSRQLSSILKQCHVQMTER